MSVRNGVFRTWFASEMSMVTGWELRANLDSVINELLLTQLKYNNTIELKATAFKLI